MRLVAVPVRGGIGESGGSKGNKGGSRNSENSHGKEVNESGGKEQDEGDAEELTANVMGARAEAAEVARVFNYPGGYNGN